MNLVAVHKLNKSFAHRTLFEAISFGVEDKARIGLIGPNGAGKSTLLRIIEGSVEPDGGQVTRKRGLRLGFLEQVPSFVDGQTIMEALLEKSEGGDYESPIARRLMAQLDLNRFGPDFLVAELSGGWRKRVALGRELVREPELLMLDEPTNHLDVSGILWLEKFIASAPFAVLMITHDRLFLQRTVNQILDLDPRNPGDLLNVPGEYARYLEAKELLMAGAQRRERVLKNTLAREREWLGRGAQARQTKQKARIESAGELGQEVEAWRQRNRSQKVDLDFGSKGPGPKRLIGCTGLTKCYGDRVLFENLELLVTPKTRLALLGDNGCGKSTLVRVLLGLEDADSGTIKRADPIEVAYFEQGRETLDPSLTVLENLCPSGEYVNVGGEFVHVRGYLERFLFSGPKAENLVGKISGGEQARLRLAQLMLKPAQVLVLDEPTNDLDSDTLDVLEDALAAFAGAVILVTHDRFFMDAVANQILAFPDGEGGELQKFANYFQWETWFNETTKAASPKQRGGGSKAAPAKPKVKISFKDKYELENMEATILALEAKLEKLNAAALENVNDHAGAAKRHAEAAAVQSELDTKYARWGELELLHKG